AVVFGDLARAYAADRFGLTAKQPPAASYTDFVSNSQSPAVAAETQADEEFWLAQFASGVPSFELPSDHPRPRIKTYAAAGQTWTIDKSLYQGLRKVGAQQGATLFVTLLAAFDVLIARLSSAESVVIGIPMASQALESNGHLVAHGVNTIPLPGTIDLE